MGVDIGFDIVPPLGPESQLRWEIFLDNVLRRYQDDPVVERHQLEIVFAVGEHPRLPHAGYAFRRFSSGPTTHLAGPYITEVRRIACIHFGDQVKIWSEVEDKLGHYGRDEVYAVRKEYISTGTEEG
jgi:hypothetical protein